MKKKSLLLILGGTLTTLFGLGLSRKKRISRPDSARILDSLNDIYAPPSAQRSDNTQEVSYPIPDMPTKLAGGKINLIRAVNDDAHNRIKEISDRIKEIDVERVQLVIELEAHNEMWAVAKKYMEKLTVKVTNK